jgi:hypothetical protein
MAAEQADPSTDPTFRFENLAPVAYVEIDRYCAGCGYNLRTQAIRREPRTQVLLTRCPECGRYQPASEATTAARLWLRRLAPLFLLGWVAVVLGSAFGLSCVLAAISYGTLEELTTWRRTAAPVTQPATLPGLPLLTTQPGGPVTVTVAGRTGQITYTGRANYVRQVRGDDPLDALFIAFVMAASFAVAFVGALILLVVFHHWRRWIYVLVVLAGPPAVAVIVALIWRDEAPHLFSWGLVYIGYHALVQLVGGLTGVAFGRPTARGLVRAFVPPSWRGPLAYLWLVDGRKPPGTADATQRVQMVKRSNG